jgi:hypothetical protein
MPKAKQNNLNMKTSNKILLGIFLTIIVLSATINLMVYAKYKRGDYEPFQREEAKLTTVNLPASKYVSITGLCSVELLNSAAPRYEVQIGKEKGITYQMVGDTVVILGNTSLTNEQMERGECNYQKFRLHLPASTEVHTYNAGVKINGKADSTEAPSFNIHLNKHSFLTMNDEDEHKYMNQLLLSGDDANLDLQDGLTVNELSLKLVNGSRFDSKKAEIRSLKLDVDNRSTINLSGNSIKNIK